MSTNTQSNIDKVSEWANKVQPKLLNSKKSAVFTRLMGYLGDISIKSRGSGIMLIIYVLILIVFFVVMAMFIIMRRPINGNKFKIQNNTPDQQSAILDLIKHKKYHRGTFKQIILDVLPSETTEHSFANFSNNAHANTYMVPIHDKTIVHKIVYFFPMHFNIISMILKTFEKLPI